MNGGRLHAGQVRHAFGRTAGRGGQQGLEFHPVKEFDHRAQRGRFPGSRAARNRNDAVPCRVVQDLPLLQGKRQALFRLELRDQLLQIRNSFLACGFLRHGGNPPRRLTLGLIQVRQVTGVLPRDSFPDQFSPLRHFFQRR